MAQTLFLLFGMMVIIKNKKIKATMLHFFFFCTEKDSGSCGMMHGVMIHGKSTSWQLPVVM